VNSFAAGGAADQILLNFNKPNRIEPILLQHVEKSFFKSGNANSGSTTGFKMDPTVDGFNFFLRPPTSGPHAFGFSPDFTNAGMHLIARFDAEVSVPRDLINFLQYLSFVENIISEILVMISAELSNRSEFEMASLVHMQLLSLSQARQSDPASSLTSVFETVYTNQVGGIPGLGARSIEVFCTAFNPMMNPEVRRLFGQLLQYPPEPTGGPMLAFKEFSEQYEAVLKIVGRPMWTIMSPYNMHAPFASVFQEIVSSRSVKNHPALSAWKAALNEYSEASDFCTGYARVAELVKKGSQLGPTSEYEQRKAFLAQQKADEDSKALLAVQRQEQLQRPPAYSAATTRIQQMYPAPAKYQSPPASARSPFGQLTKSDSKFVSRNALPSSLSAPPTSKQLQFRPSHQKPAAESFDSNTSSAKWNEQISELFAQLKLSQLLRTVKDVDGHSQVVFGPVNEDPHGEKIAFVPAEVFDSLGKQDRYAIAKLREKTNILNTQLASVRKKPLVSEQKQMSNRHAVRKPQHQRPSNGRKAYLGAATEESDSESQLSLIRTWEQDDYSETGGAFGDPTPGWEEQEVNAYEDTADGSGGGGSAFLSRTVQR
jgi:hypothetical protein